MFNSASICNIIQVILLIFKKWKKAKILNLKLFIGIYSFLYIGILNKVYIICFKSSNDALDVSLMLPDL